eukprot:GILJ01003977.1.p1 GENE.GILJ01003977.1~~GILJ01003977.1.p1  ORF type:complete len:367 (-),score=34.24 GILJ01003977.1:110-1210(-)
MYLPSNLVLVVLRLLDEQTRARCRVVDIRWGEVAKHPSLWKNFELFTSLLFLRQTMQSFPLLEDRMRQYMKSKPFSRLIRVFLDQSYKFDRLSLVQLLPPTVETFTLYEVPSSELLQCLSTFPKLKSLEFDFPFRHTYDVVPLVRIASLTRLTVYNFAWLNLHIFIQGLPNLQELQLRNVQLSEELVSATVGSSSLTSVDLQHSMLEDQTLCQLIEGCPRLTSLNLMSRARPVGTKPIMAIALHMSNLSRLNIGFSSADADSVVGVIATNPNLTEISLCGCKHVNDTVLDAIALYSKRIVALDISRCTSKELTRGGVIRLLNSLRSLQRFTALSLPHLRLAHVRSQFAFLPYFIYDKQDIDSANLY